MRRCVVIDYGSGNLRSAAKAVERAAAVDVAVEVSGDPASIRTADRIILPGVGAFADCRSGLDAVEGLIDALEARVRRDGVPMLGICVGMQLMAERGLEYAATQGLGWITGEVVPLDTHLRVPHMGWNELEFTPAVHPLLAGIEPGAHAYFVHSYRFATRDPADLVATVDYGGPRRGGRRTGQLGRHPVPSREEPGHRATADRQLPRVEPMTRTPILSVERLTQYHGNDLDDLCEATAEAINAGGGFGWIKTPRRPVLESYWSGVLLVPERQLFVGRIDGTIAGAAQLFRPPRNAEAQAHWSNLSTLFVAPWARRRGLASMMIRTVEETARASGATHINVDTRETQEEANRLFAQHGYERWGVHPAYARIEGALVKGYYATKCLESEPAA